MFGISRYTPALHCSSLFFAGKIRLIRAIAQRDSCLETGSIFSRPCLVIQLEADVIQLPRLRLPNQAMLQHECDNAAMCFDVVQVQVEAGDASAVVSAGII